MIETAPRLHEGRPDSDSPQQLSRLRIATWNAQCARRPEIIASSILSSPRLRASDIIFLQEVESHTSETAARAEKIARMCGFRCAYVPARSAGKGGTHGLAILSRSPLSGVRSIELGRCDLAFNSRKRIAIAADIEIGGSSARIYNVHLDTRINPEMRIEQLQPVFDDLEARPCERALIAGDFNTIPIRWAGSVFPRGRANHISHLDSKLSKHGFCCHSRQIGPTLRGPLRFELDSIFSRGFAAAEAGIEYSVLASDHFPVWTDVLPLS